MSLQKMSVSVSMKANRVCARIAGVCGLSIVLAQSAIAQNDTSLPAIPDHFQEAGLSRNKGYENQAVNEVIDTFSGRLQYHFTDLFIPGNGGMDIAVQRSYNAIDDPLATTVPWPNEFSPAGLGWTLHFGRIIRGANQAICSSNWSTSTKNPVLELPDGQRKVLYEADQSTPTMWVTKDFWRATCDTSSGVLGFTVQSPDGTKYEMTTPGHSFGTPGQLLKAYYTTRIVDRNNNVLNVGYTQVNGVWAVSNISHPSDGRSLTFSYNSLGLTSISDGSRTWNYTMTTGAGGQNYLTQVTRPDGLSWKYGYRSTSPGTGSMNRVEYPGGGTIDYTYDHVYFRVGVANAKPSTVIKTKVTTPGGGSSDPVATWTYSYAPATDRLPYTTNADGTISYWYNVPNVGTASNGGTLTPSQLDITTVSGPEPGRVVKHYHLGVRSVSASGAAGRGIGRYVGRETSLEHQLFSYQNILISGQYDATGSLLGTPDSSTYAAVRRYESYGEPSVNVGSYTALNEVSKSGFDRWGNPSTIQESGYGGYTDTFSRTRALTYSVNTAKWLIHQVSEEVVTVGGESHTTKRTFDSANGNVLSETVAGVPTSFTYFSTGDIQTRTNALNQTTTYSSYKRGIAQNESQPGGVVLKRIVDDAGNVASSTNGRNFTTTYTFDGLNRVKSITPPVGNPITVNYTALTRQVTRDGMQSVQTFDGLGRKVREEVSAQGESPIAVDYRYDARGRKVFQSHPNSSSGVTYSYDDKDRLIETTYPTLAAKPYSVFNSYLGMRTVVRDSTDRFTALYHRGFGDPEKQELIEARQGRSADGETFTSIYRVLLQRNVLGQVTSVVKGKAFDGTGGWTRSYGYNANFYLTSQTDPEVGTTIFGRDLLGNLTSKKIGSQPAVIYGLDARNRVGTITYSPSESALVPQAPNVTYTYLNNDAVDSVTSGGVVRSYVYDGSDKITSETLTVEAGRTFTVGYGYNGNEALSTVTYPSGRVVSYNPDGYGRPRAASPYVTGVTYHPNSNPQQITYANGVAINMGLNERLWPSSLHINRAGGNVVQSSYDYDLAGNLTAISDSADSAYSRTFEYDHVDRLTKAASGGGTYGYVYDNVGNITSVNEERLVDGVSQLYLYKNYVYDGTSNSPIGTGRLLSFGTPSSFQYFTYDSSGNVISDDTGMTYGYDRANNMRCANCGVASQTLHVYDGANMRVKSTEGGSSVFSFYDHRGLLLQTEKPGVERKELIYLGRRQVAEHKFPLN